MKGARERHGVQKTMELHHRANKARFVLSILHGQALHHVHSIWVLHGQYVDGGRGARERESSWFAGRQLKITSDLDQEELK